MKRLFFLLFVSILPFISKAQEIDSIKLQNKGFFRVHFIIPGIDYEKPIANNITCKIGLLTGVSYGNYSGWNFTPYLTVDQRYYFSFRKQDKALYRDRYFSNFYLSLQEIYFFKENDFFVVPLIGYQVSFARIMYFDVDFGLGAGYQSATNKFSPFFMQNLALGLILDF